MKVLNSYEGGIFWEEPIILQKTVCEKNELF